ncbi:type III secretion system effector zinc metalloprotease NleC [Escherichia coli]|uniref:type III secretion system effector zinc metalloprotease NleC n=1 Tax=Escherichia coli TaxID=562 RepID=UPI0006A539EB|nr:type III secretion system effector zinc metalloprotease NleC [Escherichia coli]EEW3794229.1 peptidase M85 [Escherichia coli]EGD4669863.1 peptidase M85 [Escherichia coli]EGE2704374.1 peptidase M85 [Escherichia coli]CTZ92321.1 T3SS secreted effector NleC-like protein [Escherichia coli]
MKIPVLQPGFNFFTPAEYSAAVAPNRAENAYADYVLDIGKRIPFSAADLSNVYESVIRAVHDSRSRLIDQHTVDMIGNTVLDALSRSQTFRDAVSYGIHNEEVHIGCIKYRNEYELNGESAIKIDDIQSLTCNELYGYDVGQEPILPICEAGENENEEPYVSFSVAPDTDSYEMPSWQEGLIHEIIHHVTGASDPPGDSNIELGPTEILARRVAQELGWSVPDFKGYAEPEREAHLRLRNLNALRQAAMRHEKNERAFFERLGTISDRYEASPDFTEYSAVSNIGYGFIQQHDFPGVAIDENLQDVNQIQLYHGAPYIFTFGDVDRHN